LYFAFEAVLPILRMEVICSRVHVSSVTDLLSSAGTEVGLTLERCGCPFYGGCSRTRRIKRCPG
jgi:hypothetical protein